MIPKHVTDDFVTFEDGFVYFWPTGQGGFSAHQLREIADELDLRNKDIQNDIDEYFARVARQSPTA